MSNRTENRYRPFRMVLKKEWKQSAVLRRVALVLMVLVTPFVILVAEASARGWAPVFRITSYNLTDLIMEPVPALIGLLWGFFALLACANAFATDRSTGNENFLLERPVSRTTVWKARLAATALNSLAVMAFGWGAWFLFSLALADPAEGVFLQSSNILLGMGAILVLVVICGGAAAAALIDVPMLAVLGGGLLATFPVLLGIYLGGASPFAVALELDPDLFPTVLITLSRLPVGVVLPLLFFPAFVYASYRVLCKGEPAGRGKRKRGAQVLFGTLAAVFVLFLLLAPLAVRANVDRGKGNGVLIPSPGSRRAVLTSGGWNGGGGYLVDTETGEELRWFPGLVNHPVWRRDGRFLALPGEIPIFSWFGLQRTTLAVLDGETGKRFIEFDLPGNCEFRSVLWVEGKIFISLVDETEWGRVKGTDQAARALRFYLAEEGKAGWKDGTIRKLKPRLRLEGMRVSTWQAFSTRGSEDQVFFAIRLRKKDLPPETSGQDISRNIGIGRLEILGDSLEGRLVGRIGGGLYQARTCLSPSGRYAQWIDAERDVENSRKLHLLDLQSEEPVPLEKDAKSTWAYWLNDDELLWARKMEGHVNLYRWKSEEGESLLLGTGTGGLFIDPSPDGRKAFLRDYHKIHSEDGDVFKTENTWIYDSGSGRVRPISMTLQERGARSVYARWADPETILWNDREHTYLENVQDPGNPVELE